MWPLILLGIAGAGYVLEKEAKAKSQAPWQLRTIATSGDPLVPKGVPVVISLYNTQTGEVRNVRGQTVSESDAAGGTTILLGTADGVTPYGYEQGKMLALSRPYYAQTPDNH